MLGGNTSDGWPGRVRTYDLRYQKPAFCQLNYWPSKTTLSERHKERVRFRPAMVRVVDAPVLMRGKDAAQISPKLSQRAASPV